MLLRISKTTNQGRPELFKKETAESLFIGNAGVPRDILAGFQIGSYLF